MIQYIIIGLIICVLTYVLASMLKSIAKVIAVILCCLLIFSFLGYTLGKEEIKEFAINIKDKILDSKIFGYFKEKANDTADVALDKLKEKIKEGLE